MAGYIGKSQGVTQVDGYTRSEADAEYANIAGDTFTGAVTGTDLTLSGGVYLGGTGSANYLDDYEEGTFTPQIIGTSITGVLSYASQLGRYTKIGNLVYVSIYINVNGITTQPDGDVKFTGLPFTVYSVQTTGVSTPYFNSVDNGNRAGTLVEAENTQTRLAFRYLTNNAVAGHYQGSEINTNSQFRISLAYTIA